MHNTSISGYIHICDWLATFCELAGCNKEDAKADAANIEGGVDAALGNGGLIPPVDSLSMWPMISGANGTSPRTEIALSYITGPSVDAPLQDGAFISGQYKLIVGKQSGVGFWWGPDYPNSSVKLNATAPGCPDASSGSGCLYQIIDDPSEHHDLSKQMPEKLQELLARFKEIGRSAFQSDALGSLDTAGMEAAVKGEYHGFVGPWLA